VKKRLRERCPALRRRGLLGRRAKSNRGAER
jgi:hypothetical protein